MPSVTVEIDGDKVTMGDIRRLSKRFDLEEMYALLRRCSNLTTDEQIDALTMPEMRAVMVELREAVGGAFVPKAK